MIDKTGSSSDKRVSFTRKRTIWVKKTRMMEVNNIKRQKKENITFGVRKKRELTEKEKIK